MVTVAPYIEDEFQAESFLKLTKYVTCEIKQENNYVYIDLLKHLLDNLNMVKSLSQYDKLTPAGLDLL